MGIYDIAGGDTTAKQSLVGRQYNHNKRYTGGREDMFLRQNSIGETETVGAVTGKIYSTSPASGAIELDNTDPITMALTAGAFAYGTKGLSIGASMLDEFSMGASGISKGILKSVKSHSALEKGSRVSIKQVDLPIGIGNITRTKGIPYKGDKPLQDLYINELKGWYDSPQFKKMMAKEYPNMDVEKYKEITLANVQKPVTTKKLDDRTKGVYSPYTRSDVAFTKTRLDKKTGILELSEVSDYPLKNRVNALDPIKPNMSFLHGKSFVDETGAATFHELGHQRLNARELIPEKLTDDLLKKNFKGSDDAADYYAVGPEFETRVQQLKKDLREEGIVDYFEEDVTPDHIKEYFELYQGRSDEMKIIYEKFSKGDIDFDMMSKIMNDKKITKMKELLSSDAADLRAYYKPEFIADMIKILPGVAGVGAGLKRKEGSTKKAGSIGELMNLGL